MKHILKIKGRDVQLSTEEARKLLAQLQDVFGAPPVIVYPPVILWPVPIERAPEPWIVTCGPGEVDVQLSARLN